MLVFKCYCAAFLPFFFYCKDFFSLERNTEEKGGGNLGVLQMKDSVALVNNSVKAPQMCPGAVRIKP